MQDVTLFRERFAWEEAGEKPKKRKSDALASSDTGDDLNKALGGNYLLSKIVAIPSARPTPGNNKLTKRSDCGHLMS